MIECPTKKIKFGSKLAAEEHIKSRKNGAKYCYLCVCGAWHLTRKRPIEYYEAEITDLNAKLVNSVSNEIFNNLKQQLKIANKTISRLRKDNADLIHKNILLQKEVENKEVPWWKQLINRYGR